MAVALLKYLSWRLSCSNTNRHIFLHLGLVWLLERRSPRPFSLLPILNKSDLSAALVLSAGSHGQTEDVEVGL